MTTSPKSGPMSIAAAPWGGARQAAVRGPGLSLCGAWIAAALAGLAACAAPGRVQRDGVAWREAVYPDVPEALGDAFRREQFTGRDGMRVPFRWLAPANGASRPAPLVVVLHGSGAIGSDNERQLGSFARAWAMPELAAAFPTFVAVPQVPARSADYAPWTDGERASRPGPALSALLELLDTLRSRPEVDPARVYLVGFSMGASTALQAVLARPETFAGVVAVAPVAPPRDAVIAARARGTPVWFVHGDADRENPIGSARLWAEALAAQGATPRFVEFAGMDHRVPESMVLGRDWRTWLFAQRR